MWQELVFAGRVCRRTPFATVAAITSIALGIAATTAIFSVTDAILWRPLPYADPARLVVASAELRNRDTRDLPLSGPDFLDLRAQTSTTFEDFAAVQTGRTLLSQGDGTLAQVRFATVSPNLFRVLGKPAKGSPLISQCPEPSPWLVGGVCLARSARLGPLYGSSQQVQNSRLEPYSGPIALGRDFVDADGEPLPSDVDVVPGVPLVQRASTVAILSHEYWLRRYGGQPDVLGQRVSTAAGTGALIVGVLAPGAELILPPELGVERLPDIWVSARIPYDVTQRATFSYRVVGRLKEGISLEQARTDVEAVASRLRSGFPLWQSAGFHIGLERLEMYVTAQVAPALLMLMAAAICLLLIACANVANLLVVQASYREREFAVRSALGAGRARLIRQTVIQALLLAGIATGVGAALAWIALLVLLSIAPANLPRIDSVAFNGTALGCSVILGLMAAVFVGLLPAVRGSQINVMALLRTDRGALALQVSRVLRGVVVAEIAVSFVLLIGSGLMLRSFAALQRLDPGFDARDVLTFQVVGNRPNAPEERQAVVRDIHSRLEDIPGVQRVTAASPFPLADPFYPIRWGRDEALADESKFHAADYQVVLPGYFETLKTQLVAGRPFANADNVPQRGVAIIDQLLARKAFGSASDAVGGRILVRIRTPEPEWVEVIGVVAHQRASALTDEGREQIYFTDGFLGHGAANRWAIRTFGDPVRYAGAVRAAIANVSPQLVLAELQPMDALVQRSEARTRFAFVLIIVLASVAAMLAAVGIYGVLSTTVRYRTAEVGTRMACGAEPRSILTLFLRQGLLLTAGGLTLGLVGALVTTRFMRTLLVAVEPVDTATFVATGLLYVVIAGAACLLPARRAAKLDPLLALRDV